MNETSVSTLIQGLKQGDHDAVEMLWARYFDKLVAMARKRIPHGGRRAWSEEDIALSVFASLCRGAEKGNFVKLTNRDDLWALLMVITRQKAIDRLRHDGREKRRWDLQVGDSFFGKQSQGDSSAIGIAGFMDDEPTPDEIVAMQETYEELIKRLPDERMRIIVEMRMQGFTVKEIAEKFGFVTRWAERKLQIIRDVWTKYLNGLDVKLKD